MGKCRKIEGEALDAERYFFVDKFYETDFQKIIKGSAMGTLIFDLTETLHTENLPNVEQIADLLRNKTWD